VRLAFDDLDTEKRLPQAVARKLLSHILAVGEVIFSAHARSEMAKDSMIEQDVINVLRAGRIHEPGEYQGRSWRYRCHTARYCVVVAFSSTTRTVVVTAWRKI
jgi:hypothetical protein